MIHRPALRTAARSALCAIGLATAALTLDATPASAGPAAAARHKPAHASKTHAAKAHGSKAHDAKTHGTSTHAKQASSKSHAAKHAAKHATKHAARHHGRARHEAPEEAVAAAEPLVSVPAVPQLALPDLAVTAATYPAGATLGGFGGPTETAMIPANSAARTLHAITASATSLLDALVSRARGQLGTRYVFGGAEPGAGLDCSSFARYAMEALGVRLPRTANQQAQIGRPIPRDASLLRPGDLLTFGSRTHVSHVGIYLGAGRFIHASVKHGAIIETTIDRNRSLFRRWQGARRLLAAAGDSSDDAGRAGG